MRTVTLAVAVAIVFAGPKWGSAQPAMPNHSLPVTTPAPLPPAPVPAPPGGRPETNPAIEAESLPGGTDVSQPLQPVLPPSEIESDTKAAAAVRPRPILDDRDPRPKKVLGGWWGNDELLIWWPKAQPIPPLVTGSRAGLPVLGQPQTTLLIGNAAIGNQDIAGYRLTRGFALNADDTVGFEGRYFFLGTRTLTASESDFTNSRFNTIGLPYVNALTGQEDVLAVARPGQSSALVTVSTSTRVQGAEANLVGNLIAKPGVKVHALAGYRFFQANEGLRVEQNWLQYPTPESLNTKTVGMVADQFDAHNEFHGGQLGLLADLHRGPFYVEMTGKVAFGTNYQVVTIDGATHLITAGQPLPLLRSFPGGVYAQPSNMGQYRQTVFAVVPEGTFKVGLKIGDDGRIFVGYNFLYLSNTVRPGDQISRTINPTQVPLLGQGGPVAGAYKPQAVIHQTDFWVQGLIVGLETRF